MSDQEEMDDAFALYAWFLEFDSMPVWVSGALIQSVFSWSEDRMVSSLSALMEQEHVTLHHQVICDHCDNEINVDRLVETPEGTALNILTLGEVKCSVCGDQKAVHTMLETHLVYRFEDQNPE